MLCWYNSTNTDAVVRFGGVGVSWQGFGQDAQHQRSGLQNFAWDARAGKERERERDGQELGGGKRSAASLGLVEAETPQHKKEREREMGKSSAEATDAASLGLVEAEAAQKECCICLKTEQLGKLLALVPCGHRCVCADCSALVVGRTCPVCRTQAREAIRVFD